MEQSVQRAFLLALALTAALLVVPGLTLVLTPLAVAPISHLVIKRETKWAVVVLAVVEAMILAGLAFSLGDPSESFRMFVPLIAIPLLLGAFWVSHTRQISSFYGFLNGTAAFVTAGLLGGVAVFKLTSHNVFTSMTREIYLTLSTVMKGTGSDALSVTVRQVTDILPGALVVLALTLSAVNFIFYYWIYQGRSGRQAIQPLQDWYIPWQFSYGFLAGLASKFYRSDWVFSRQVEVIGNNLLFIFSVIFFIQGLAVASFLIGKSRLRGPLKWLTLIGAVILQYAVQLLTWLGLLDVWFDYRKKYIDRNKEAAG